MRGSGTEPNLTPAHTSSPRLNNAHPSHNPGYLWRAGSSLHRPTSPAHVVNMADRPYESIALYNGNEGEGKTQYSVRYNGLSKPLPWLQPQNGDGKELSKPAGSVFPILLEIVLCAVAVCFIVLAGLAVWMKDRPTGDSLGSDMETVMKLGPTVYPIVFAALFSRSLKNIGRYRAQQGTRLMSLWTLMNTSTVSDPIAHMLSIPGSILVWCLLPLWAMSPIGGQGSLRLMYRANITDVNVHGLRYWDNGPLGNAFTYQTVAVGNDGAHTPSMRDIYSAGLMQGINTKSGPLDQWRNVKIPRLPEDASKADSDGWIPTPQDAAQVESYSSLFGLPIIGLDEFNDGDLHFTVETAYVELSCPPMHWITGYDGVVDMDMSTLNITCIDCHDDYGKVAEARCSSLLGPPLPQFTAAMKANSSFAAPRRINFSSRVWNGISTTTCDVTQRLVETFVECIAGNCAATKIRPSRTDHRSRNVTSFDYWGMSTLEMITEDRKETSSGARSRSGTSALFLQDSGLLPLQIIGQDLTSMDGKLVNLSSVSPELFAARASMLLNAGLQTLMNPSGFAGSLSTNLTKYGPGHLPADGLLVAASNRSEWEESDPFDLPLAIQRLGNARTTRFLAASTNATVTRYTEVYKPSYAWVTLLVISSGILFCTGAVGICVRLVTMAPDIFDPVIGLTYSNEYMPPGTQQGLLNTRDRLRGYGKTRVQLGYVEDESMMRKVVFGETTRVRPLEQGALYH